jgi:hypothetical protein
MEAQIFIDAKKVEEAIKLITLKYDLYNEYLQNAIEDDASLFEICKHKGSIRGFHQSLVILNNLLR